MSLRSVSRVIYTVFFAVVFLSACGGSHNAAIPALPGTGEPAGHAVHKSSIGSVSGDVAAIDCGSSAAVGGFAADTDFGSGAGTWTYTTAAAIDTSAVPSPLPQAVYQTQRVGATLTYTIPGLAAGGSYRVVLGFVEAYFNTAGSRVFNVAINSTTVLTHFDVFAAANAKNKAVSESFAATASPAGTITITLTATTNYAIVGAIEIQAVAATPTPTPTATPTPVSTALPSGAVWIDGGGPAAGAYAADEDVTGTALFTASTVKAIATPGVTNPAPQAVYQTQRVGNTIRYTIPLLPEGAAYAVRLDFAEIYFTTAGKRVFNVSINGTTVLTNFDIVAAAGSGFTAVSQTFPATATASGNIVILLTAVTNYAAINGIEVTPAGSTPSPVPSTFNNYPMFGFDSAHDAFNPNSTAITPATVPNLHLAWQTAVGDFNTQTQPILAAGIAGHPGLLFVGGGSGTMYGYDALTGGQVWKRFLGQESYTAANCGTGTQVMGIGGTAAYDPGSQSIYVVGNVNSALNAYPANSLFHLDAATGTLLGQVNFSPTAAGPSEINFGHTAVTLANGVAYAGTGTTCDIPSWRGRVVAVNVPAMTVANTFFTTWDPQNARGFGAQPWGGGGVWGWGGVSLDPSGDVLTGVGNVDNGSNGPITAPFTPAPQEYSGFGESLLELSGNLSTVIADNHPVPVNSYNTVSNDLDVQGTPLVFTPSGAGCGTMVALQGKSGELTVYDEAQINTGFAAQYQLSPSTFSDGYLGDPAYSPVTGLVYAPVASTVSPSLFAPGMIAVNPGCGSPSVAWHSSFGIDSSSAGVPRSVPAATAGGVVFAGTVASGSSGGDVWAIDAASGTVLNGGTPVLVTSGRLRMPPTIDGDWIFIIDESGNVYGLTIDSSVPAIKARAVMSQTRESGRRVVRAPRFGA